MRFLAILSALFQGGAMAVFALLVAYAPFRQSHEDVAFAADAYILAAGLNFLAAITSDRRAGVDFLVSFFFLFFIAIPAQMQVGTGLFPWLARLGPQELALGYGLLALSQLSFAIGQGIALRRPVLRSGDVNLTLEAGHFYTKWAWGIAGFALLCAVAAGPSNLLVARFERGQANFGSLTQQFLFMGRSTSLLAFVMMIYLARFLPHGGLRRQNMQILLLFVPIFLIINFPPALPRFVLFGTAIAVICMFFDFSKPFNKLISAVAAIMVLFMIFPFAKQIATGDFQLSTFIGSIGNKNLSLYLAGGDFDGFMQIVSAIQYLDRDIGGLRWGYNFLGAALFFVPRALWSGKPIDTGEIVSTGLGYWYTNVSCPLPAEALMAFGLIGPVLVFSLLGWFVTRVELRAGFPGRGTAEMSRFVLYAILMGFIVIILRGAINGVAPQFASGFFAYAMMMLARSNRVVWGYAR